MQVILSQIVISLHRRETKLPDRVKLQLPVIQPGAALVAVDAAAAALAGSSPISLPQHSSVCFLVSLSLPIGWILSQIY